MRAMLLKSLALVALVALVSAACPQCYGRYAEVEFNDPNEDPNCFDPPTGGPISGNAITVTGIEAHNDNATIDYREGTIWKWNEPSQSWGQSIDHSSWTGEWHPTGVCSHEREISVTFEGLDVTQGLNRFKAQLYIKGPDSVEDWDMVEFEYYNP